MLRFTFKLILFFAPILLTLGLVEHRLKAVSTVYHLKRAYLERNVAGAQVLITGSSHAYYGIKPGMLGVPAFSIAYAGQDIYYDTRILLQYLPRAGNAKLVIVTISYFSFGRTLENTVESWRTSYYYQFWGIPHASPGLRMGDYSLIALYGVPQTRKFLWEGNLDETLQHIDEGGAYADLRVTNAATVAETATVERQTSHFDYGYVAKNEKYLAELFEALKARGIPAVMVTVPCFHSYYENMNPGIYRVMQERIQSLSQEYQLEYYNYLRDPRFTGYDFYDSDHLSTAGAEKFSLILSDEVIRKYFPMKVNRPFDPLAAKFNARNRKLDARYRLELF